MPMNPYVLVLAGTPSEAAQYIRRANLPRGRWRIAVSAGSIRGIRKAHVHALPSFHDRRDKHSILTELRYAKCEWFDVEMPPRPEKAPIDQGDGMGEQLTIEDALSAAAVIDQHVDAIQNAAVGGSDSVTAIADAVTEHNAELTDALEAHADRDQGQDVNSDRFGGAIEKLSEISEAAQDLADAADDEKVTAAVEAKIAHNDEMITALSEADEEERPYNSDDAPNVVEFIGKKPRAKAKPKPPAQNIFD